MRASLVVFLVALPLCAGIAVASGVPVELGFVTGIVGGILVGALPGSSLQVSGPAAGLTVLVADIVDSQGLRALGAVVLLAGLLQVGLGLARLGRWFRAVSTAVVQGMLAGIGLTLVLGQLYLLADREQEGGPIANLAGYPAALASLPADGAALTALAVGVGSLLVLRFWRFAPARLRVVPAPLAAVLLATAVSAGAGLDVDRVEVRAVLDVVTPLTPGTLDGLSPLAVLGAALTVALIASAESMFSATAIDRTHTGPRTDYDKELVAQGVGNGVCGVLGALPMTAVVVRSSANVSAGARTKASGVLHGVWLAVFALAAPALLGFVPMAALAAVLVQAGCKLVAGIPLRRLWSASRSEVAITVATIVAILALNLLEGVAIGLVLSLVKAAVQASSLRTRLHERDDEVHLEVSGSATFVRLPQLADTLASVPDDRPLTVHLTEPDKLDRACREAVDTFVEQRQARGNPVALRVPEPADRTS
ncbi:SulP family inorganic anion transporter [Kineococcus aurantiacus]|uniref:MFS superfamily sulfate permease-like transporter n=1 Tax=Kineococcus aurantiacus TaxID=37633 RepID=A0A7Y9J189_9ACTN|nr:MFS superfamily sulfate permease-like transporter [Kineococcus aurantiacus]